MSVLAGPSRRSPYLNRYDDGGTDRVIGTPSVEGTPVWWCVYGCPTSPWWWSEVERVLWGSCSHPIDLTPGAATKHEAHYPCRVEHPRGLIPYYDCPLHGKGR